MMISLAEFTSTLATSTTSIASQRVSAEWPWYVIRGSGFVAASLLILLMLSGIGQVTGIVYRYIEPVKMWTIHKAMGISLAVSIAIHGSMLLIDHYIPFSLVQILVPFASRYNNGTKLFGLPFQDLGVTFGILAMYGIAIIIASSLGWIDTKKKTWRLLHYISYVVALLVFLHATYVGTDLRYGVFRVAWVSLGLIIVVGILARLWRVGTMRGKKANTPTDIQ